MTQAIVKPSSQPLAASAIAKPEIIWEKLPANFILPDDPVESIAQPLLAAALNDSLELSQHLAPETMVAYNMALVVKINQKTIVKAPDWFYVAKVNPVGKNVIRRSYSPHIDGEVLRSLWNFFQKKIPVSIPCAPHPPTAKCTSMNKYYKFPFM